MRAKREISPSFSEVEQALFENVFTEYYEEGLPQEEFLRKSKLDPDKYDDFMKFAQCQFFQELRLETQRLRASKISNNETPEPSPISPTQQYTLENFKKRYNKLQIVTCLERLYQLSISKENASLFNDPSYESLEFELETYANFRRVGAATTENVNDHIRSFQKLRKMLGSTYEPGAPLVTSTEQSSHKSAHQSGFFAHVLGKASSGDKRGSQAPGKGL